MLEIKSKKSGAELTSVKLDGKEMLHQGEFWNRHAPILFPIVGRLKNDETIIDGEIYHMGQHGFARDMEFKELEKSENKHEYVLESNSETLEKFPFEFNLYVTHLVEDNTIITEYKVVNKDKKEMIFGLGGHPAFICDYSSGKYKIEFEKQEDNIKFMSLKDGLVLEEEAPNILSNNCINLNKDSFINDAIIMKNIKSNKVYLKENERTVLEFDFTGFPYLGLWAKIGAPFVCIEPWMNTADKVNTDGKLESKENILKLEPNEEFKCSYKMLFFRTGSKNSKNNK